MAARVCCRLSLKSPLSSFVGLQTRCFRRAASAARQISTLNRSCSPLTSSTPLLSPEFTNVVLQLNLVHWAWKRMGNAFTPVICIHCHAMSIAEAGSRPVFPVCSKNLVQLSEDHGLVLEAWLVQPLLVDPHYGQGGPHENRRLPRDTAERC